jgi:hypothetical protein
MLWSMRAVICMQSSPWLLGLGWWEAPYGYHAFMCVCVCAVRSEWRCARWREKRSRSFAGKLQQKMESKSCDVHSRHEHREADPWRVAGARGFGGACIHTISPSQTHRRSRPNPLDARHAGARAAVRSS